MDGLSIGRFLIAALVVLLAPGCALLAWLPAAPAGAEPGRQGVLSWLADAAALSIAIPALLALGFFLAGVRVSGGVAAGLYGLCLLSGLAGVLKRGVALRGWRKPLALDLGRWAVGLLAVIFLAGLVAWRLYQARTLAIPNWVDSVQHFLIVRKIGEYGGLPPDLEPYLPVPFSYHYGFHLVAALFTFLSGLTTPKAAVWFGQVLNALVAISVYRGAEAFAGRTVAGSLGPSGTALFARPLAKAAPMIAALLVGFDFQMPAYYLTWGRYTMLAGLLLLGPTLAAVQEVRDQPKHWPAWVRLVLLIAGQALTHYFILLLTGLFFVVIGLESAVRGFRHSDSWKALARLAVLALLGIMLASPWLVRSLHDFFPETGFWMRDPFNQSEALQKSTVEYGKYLWYLIGPRRNQILMGMAGVGALAAILQPRLYPLLGWGLVVVLLSLPWAPRLAVFRPDHYSIVLFFPAAILLAELLSSAGKALCQRTRPAVGMAALALAGLLFLAWGLRDTQNMVNTATILAGPADVTALEWVKEHTPPDARFYINGALWQGKVYRGVDGGAWLLPYTGRFSLVPPISYDWGAAAYTQQVNDWAKRSTEMKGCNPAFWSLVRDADLTYVYLHQGKGSLQPEMLATCQRLRQVYAQGGVYIYEILLPR